MDIHTLSELFLVALGHRKPDCLQHKVGGRYVSISSEELGSRVRALAQALRGLGVARGDRVAMMAENGPHWPTVDFAALCAGTVHVPIYPTLLPEQAAYIANDSGAKVVFAQGRERLDGLLAIKAQMPTVQHFFLIEVAGEAPTGVRTLESLLEEGKNADPAQFEAEAKKARPDELATLIYTSGTTGNPKGVMLTHGNLTSNVIASVTRLPMKRDYVALSFLPLAHSFERTIDYIYYYTGMSIAYAESVAAVAQNMGEVKPHVFVSVPRIYEKVLARVRENVAKSSRTKQKIFRWAVGVGREALPWRLKAAKPPGLLGIKLALADRLVFHKIRERLGGRFVFAASGGGPLGRDVAEFFWGAGIAIYEGYGLTETSPVLTVNYPGHVKLGTVGPTIPGVEIQLAPDGEILARGPNIMKGYYNNPQATAETIDAEGWLHTGDIGTLDADNFLTITDRKKELIVSAYGKNIAPAPIENQLKASRFVSQAVVIGDRRPFLIALLVPDFEALRPWAARQGIQAVDDKGLLADLQVRQMLAREIEGVNQHLARYEQVKAWDLLPKEFTLETGELTPTMKVKRRVIHQKYGEVIDRVYRDNQQAA